MTSGPLAAEERCEFEAQGIDLGRTLRSMITLRNDPTVRLGASRFERATQTPVGPGSIRIEWSLEDAQRPIIATAWGAGAHWLLERAPAMAGVDDDVTGFGPTEEPLRRLWRQQEAVRMPTTSTVWHDASCFILQQRVTTTDAGQQWAAMTRALGEPAPGPVELQVPASAGTVASLPYTEFHRFGIERQRADYLRGVASIAHRLEAMSALPFTEARPKLETVRGLGPWTLGWMGAQTWGDPDAVMTGDFGLPSMVTWFFDRQHRGTDDRMLELLEPFRPHRHRVIKLIYASGSSPPRRHHKYARNDIRRR